MSIIDFSYKYIMQLNKGDSKKNKCSAALYIYLFGEFRCRTWISPLTPRRTLVAPFTKISNLF